MYIDIHNSSWYFRYEIYLDEVKPKDLSVNFLQEFMDLPLSYLAPGAAVKFRKYLCLLLLTFVIFVNTFHIFTAFAPKQGRRRGPVVRALDL